MRYRSPNSVRFPIYTENSYRYPCTSGRSAALGITAKAIDSAVERNKHAVDVHHTDRADITVSDRISFERFFIRVFRCLLYRCRNLHVFFVDAIHAEYFYENTLSGLKMTPYVEADMSRRFLLDLNDTQGHAAFLSLSASGLVSTADALPARSGSWRFPVIAPGDYSDKAMTAKLTTEAATLYKSVKDDSYYGRVAMQLDMLVEKSEEERAAEIARIIFSLREQRMSIVTGDTDATYSGSAMEAALSEITRLEQEYLSLFIGYSEYGTQSCVFDMVPDKDRENQMYIAFRFSETAYTG